MRIKESFFYNYYNKKKIILFLALLYLFIFQEQNIR